MVKTDDVVGSHGSAQGEFLSDEVLHLFHLLVHCTLGFAAGSEITASKAVQVLSLGIREAQLGSL